jgi:hypothetical protein
MISSRLPCGIYHSDNHLLLVKLLSKDKEYSAFSNDEFFSIRHMIDPGPSRCDVGKFAKYAKQLMPTIKQMFVDEEATLKESKELLEIQFGQHFLRQWVVAAYYISGSWLPDRFLLEHENLEVVLTTLDRPQGIFRLFPVVCWPDVWKIETVFNAFLLDEAQVSEFQPSQIKRPASQVELRKALNDIKVKNSDGRNWVDVVKSVVGKKVEVKEEGDDYSFHSVPENLSPNDFLYLTFFVFYSAEHLSKERSSVANTSISSRFANIVRDFEILKLAGSETALFATAKCRAAKYSVFCDDVIGRVQVLYTDYSFLDSIYFITSQLIRSMVDFYETSEKIYTPSVNRHDVLINERHSFPPFGRRAMLLMMLGLQLSKFYDSQPRELLEISHATAQEISLGKSDSEAKTSPGKLELEDSIEKTIAVANGFNGCRKETRYYPDIANSILKFFERSERFQGCELNLPTP